MKRDELLEQALAALPPLSEERRLILQPLADEELFVCFQKVRADLVDHIRAKHSSKTNRPSSHAVGAFELLMEQQTEDEFREVFLQFVSHAVSDYWAHVTEGHAAPAASSEDYLRWRVGRIRPDDYWWSNGRIAVECGLAVRPQTRRDPEAAAQLPVRLTQLLDEHRPERPILLAVDRQLGEGAAFKGRLDLVEGNDRHASRSA